MVNCLCGSAKSVDKTAALKIAVCISKNVSLKNRKCG